MKVVSAIGDSIVDTVIRCTVTDTTQWLYKLMQALGETNIRLEPLAEFGETPNILTNKWITDAKTRSLCNGRTDEYTSLAYDTFEIDLSPYYESGTLAYAVRAFTELREYTLKVYVSADGVNWPGWPDTPIGVISKPEGHEAGWSFCNWLPTTTQYVRLSVIGDMKVSEIQVLSNLGNDRGTCLNKMVGQNYTFHNVGIGSQYTSTCLDRFVRDVVDIGSDVVIILAGINDIYYNHAPATTQNNLLRMYDLADAAKIKPIPVTLLPYTPNALTEDRYLEIKSKIEALNAWIRSTAQIRGYGLCDWYSAMTDPNNPGHMYSTYTCDGIHLSLLGNTKIVEAFDLSQLSVITHDFYAAPLFEVPFNAQRVGRTDTINFTFGNNIDTNYQIYRGEVSGVTLINTSLVGTYAAASGTASISYIPEGWYRCYNINTHVWSNEIYVESAPIRPDPPALGQTPKLVVAKINKLSMTAQTQIEERDLDLV